MVLPVLIMKFSRARELPPEQRRRRKRLMALPSAGWATAARSHSALCRANFHRPAAPSVDRYTRAMSDTTSAAPGAGGPPTLSGRPGRPRNWWTLFGSEELDALVSQALRGNPMWPPRRPRCGRPMRTRRRSGAAMPHRAGSFQAAAIATPPEWSSPRCSRFALYSLYTPQVTVSYVRTSSREPPRVESLARRPSARYQLDATYLTLTATS